MSEIPKHLYEEIPNLDNLLEEAKKTYKKTSVNYSYDTNNCFIVDGNQCLEKCSAPLTYKLSSKTEHLIDFSGKQCRLTEFMVGNPVFECVEPDFYDGHIAIWGNRVRSLPNYVIRFWMTMRRACYEHNDLFVRLENLEELNWKTFLEQHYSCNTMGSAHLPLSSCFYRDELAIENFLRGNYVNVKTGLSLLMFGGITKPYNHPSKFLRRAQVLDSIGRIWDKVQKEKNA